MSQRKNARLKWLTNSDEENLNSYKTIRCQTRFSETKRYIQRRFPEKIYSAKPFVPVSSSIQMKIKEIKLKN